MPEHRVTVFRPYAFSIGEKIHIEGGPRGGDWEVIGLDDAKMKLRCPVSGKEVEWAQFCHLVRQEDGRKWPMRD